jgi:hypothetical protein
MAKRNTTTLQLGKCVIPKSRTEKISVLADEAREIYDQLEPLFDRPRQVDLLRRYQVGEILKAAVPDLKKRANKKPALRSISDNLVTCLAEALGVRDRTLYRCLQLAREYRPSKFRKLAAYTWVTWTHFVHLLNVKGPKLRREMERKLIAEVWTSDQLKEGIAALQPNMRQGTGCPLKVPGSLGDAFGQVISTAKGVAKRTDEVWFGDRYDIGAVLEGRQPTELDEETLQQSGESIDAMKSMVLAGCTGIRKIGEQTPQQIDESIEALKSVDAAVREELQLLTLTKQRSEEQPKGQMNGAKERRPAAQPKAVVSAEIDLGSEDGED